MNRRKLLKALWMPFRRTRGRIAMGIGRASSAKPLCRGFGYSRGTPIDRFYIERFLDLHREDVQGRVLEIGDDSYSRRFGGDRVTRQDVLHIDPDAPGATIGGDLAAPGTLPASAFDCIILTQTLHLLYDVAAAIAQVRSALRPGGVALITVPGISPIDRGQWGDSWHWSFTERALERLAGLAFEPGKVTVTTYGNLAAATAFLHGAAVEETGRARLLPFDPAYPVTVAARCQA